MVWHVETKGTFFFNMAQLRNVKFLNIHLILIVTKNDLWQFDILRINTAEVHYHYDNDC